MARPEKGGPKTYLEPVDRGVPRFILFSFSSGKGVASKGQVAPNAQGLHRLCTKTHLHNEAKVGLREGR